MPQKNFFSYSLWGVLYGTIFLVFFASSVSSLDPDFGWHIRVGRDTIEGVPMDVETRLFPILGERWVDHDWIANIFLYKIFSSSEWGYWILGVFFSFVMTGMLAAGTFFARKRYAADVPRPIFLFFAFLLQGFGVSLLLDYFGIRPQIFSWLFFLLEAYIFAEYFRTRNIRAVLFFPLLFFVWANMHGTFIVGLFLLAVFLLLAMLFEERTIQQKSVLFLAGILSLAATFLTPHPLALWKMVLVEYSQNTYYFLHIAEWIPVYAMPPFLWKETVFIGCVLACLFVYWQIERERMRQWSRNERIFFLFSGAVFLAMAVKARRNIPIFFLLSYPFLLAGFSRLGSNIRTPKTARAAAIFVFIFLVFLSGYFFVRLFETPKNPFAQNFRDFPYGAAKFLLENRQYDDRRLFNEYGWGGYLNWMMPGRLLFIDGRMPQRPIAEERSYLEEYDRFFDEETCRQQIDRYGIELLLLKKEKPKEFSPGQQWMLRYLFRYDAKKSERKDFILSDRAGDFAEKIFEDDRSVLYAIPKKKE